MKYTKEQLDGMQFYNGGWPLICTIRCIEDATCSITWGAKGEHSCTESVVSILGQLNKGTYKPAGYKEYYYEIY